MTGNKTDAATAREGNKTSEATPRGVGKGGYKTRLRLSFVLSKFELEEYALKFLLTLPSSLGGVRSLGVFVIASPRGVAHSFSYNSP
jgi:hypothetical protein